MLKVHPDKETGMDNKFLAETCCNILSTAFELATALVSEDID